MSDTDPWSMCTREQMSEHSAATQLLAHCLWSGRLTLLLGAGVSKPMGLPDWFELVASAASMAGDPSLVLPKPGGVNLLEVMDKIRLQVGDEADFLELVRKALYEPSRLTANNEYDDTALTQPLLGAIGALVMASARGSAAEVINLNFDDVLEWYLRMHGFSTQIIHELPKLIDGHQDVSIYHVHGFLPLARHLFRQSSSIILSRAQYVTRMAEDGTSPWNAFLLSRLHSKVLLAIGTSLSDIDIGITLKRAHTAVSDIRPLGFVLGQHDDDQAATLREQALVPVHFDDHDELPSFLLGVCRYAAEIQAASRF